ncbi:hypothetical protein ACJX0J_017333, partial [Zea mays]
ILMHLMNPNKWAKKTSSELLWMTRDASTEALIATTTTFFGPEDDKGKGLDVSREKLYRGGFGGFRSVVWIWNSGAGLLCAGEYSLKICLELPLYSYRIVAEGLEKNQDSSFGESQEDMEEDAGEIEQKIISDSQLSDVLDNEGSVDDRAKLYHTEEDGEQEWEKKELSSIVLENYDNQIDLATIAEANYNKGMGHGHNWDPRNH